MFVQYIPEPFTDTHQCPHARTPEWSVNGRCPKHATAAAANETAVDCLLVLRCDPAHVFLVAAAEQPRPLTKGGVEAPRGRGSRSRRVAMH